MEHPIFGIEEEGDFNRIVVLHRMMGTFWKLARIGERKSQYVAVACIGMAMSILFWS